MINFTFKEGFVTQRTAMALNQIVRWINAQDSRFEGDSGQRTQERIIVKLTAQNGATPPVYSGTEQSFTVAGAYEDMPNGRLFTPTNMPIYERNGNRITSFPFYTEIIRRILVNGVPTYEFDIGAAVELKGLTFTSDTDSTADSDPGSGVFKWNNATQGSATTLYFDNLTADGVDSATFFASLASTGFLYLQQSDDSTKWQLWRWTAVTAGAGYYKFTVTLQANAGSIADAKTVYTVWDGTSPTGTLWTLAGRTGTSAIAVGDTVTFNNGTVSGDAWTPDTASASLAGIMSTATQQLAGLKEFLNGFGTDNINVTETASNVWSLTSASRVFATVEDRTGAGGSGGTILLKSFAEAPTPYGRLEIEHAAPFAGTLAARLGIASVSFAPSGSTLDGANTVNFGIDGAGGVNVSVVNAAGTSQVGFTISEADDALHLDPTLLFAGPSRFAVRGNYGVTGTGGGGDTVTGGIITTLGSGANIQTLLDGISTTQGVILYYNGTDWVALATGTAGQYLRTGGAGANPTWSSTGGDLSGVPSNATVAKINGVALGSTTATSKNILIADGSSWVTRALSGGATLNTNAGVIHLDPYWVDGFALSNGYITASAAAGVLTVEIKNAAGSDPSASDPVWAVFRSATASSGALQSRSITAANSFTISSGSTLGITSGKPARIWIVLFDDGGTIRLGAVNCLTTTDIFHLCEDDLHSSTAEGGAGGADSAHVIYTGSAVTTKAFRVLGYLEWTSFTTAGTWTAPDQIQNKTQSTSLPGQEVQSARVDDGAVATGTTTTPADDTIPQNTEGDQYLSQAITPTSAANLLQIVCVGNYSNSGTNRYITQALFQDTTANALAAVASFYSVATSSVPIPIGYIMLAATTSATTFKIRAGADAASTTTFNGSGGGRLYGGVYNSYLEIREIMA